MKDIDIMRLMLHGAGIAFTEAVVPVRLSRDVTDASSGRALHTFKDDRGLDVYQDGTALEFEESPTSKTEGARKAWMVFNSTGALDGISVL
jgi:hypothetical protein